MHSSLQEYSETNVLITATYQNAYNGLNTFQRKAVNTVYGPVMVIAGPGTGKTEMLAVRVGHILLQPDVRPSNILCLTFSNAGVDSMKKRLKQLIGPTAEQITVNTFHSFCNRVIQRAGQENEFHNRSLITGAQQYAILEELLCDASLAGDYFSLKPPSSFLLKSLADVLSDMKKEGVDAAGLSLLINNVVENVIPFEDEYVYKRNRELNAKGREKIQKLVDFAAIGRLYEAYNKALRQLGYVEYEDMIDTALQVLQENNDLLLDYREQYQFILVDEFQDTNSKQVNLLKKLISTDEQPNIFFVGDDDQCIYRFQGASRENINWVQQHLQNMVFIELDQNYRSTQHILDAAGGFITHNKDRKKFQQVRLTAARKDMAHALSELVLRQFTTVDQEAFHVCKKIKHLLQSNQEASEIAVLYRKNAQADVLFKWLRYFKIPYVRTGFQKDLLETHEGKKITALLHYLNVKEKDGRAAGDCLINLMLLDADEVESIVLYHRHVDYKKRCEAQKEEPQHFSEWLKNAPVDKNSGFLLRLQQAESLISSWDQPISEEGLQLFYRIVFLTENAVVHNAWRHFINDFRAGDKSKSWQSLSNLIQYHVRYGLKIGYDAADKTAGKIILSTLHGSKGLEYKNVFIIGCNDNIWEDAREPSGAVSVPKELKKYLNRMGDDHDDLRRLLYVGVTRSKVNLYLSCASKSANVKPHRPSCFLHEMAAVLGSNLEISEDVVLPAPEEEAYTINVSDPLHALFTQKVADFRFTASSVNSFIECENTFVLTNLLKIPSLPDEIRSFGSALHNTLEAIYTKHTASKPGEAEMAHLWDNEMQKLHYHFHPLHYEKYRQYGKETLRTYIGKAWKETAVQTQCEVWLEAEIHSFKLKGKVDRIDKNGNELTVIDYKSGSAFEGLKEFENEKNPGTGYWRQGAIYSDLIKQTFPDKVLKSMVFDYVETYDEDKPKVKELKPDTIPAQWYHYLQNAWGRVQQLNFKKQCAQENCVYCALAGRLFF